MSFTLQQSYRVSLLPGPEMGKLIVPLKQIGITPLDALMSKYKSAGIPDLTADERTPPKKQNKKRNRHKHPSAWTSTVLCAKGSLEMFHLLHYKDKSFETHWIVLWDIHIIYHRVVCMATKNFSWQRRAYIFDIFCAFNGIIEDGLQFALWASLTLLLNCGLKT